MFGIIHPQIVHFVIALLPVGVALRLVALSGRLRFTGPAATVLILVGTVAAFIAVETGEDEHRASEMIPGVHEAVEVHQEWGERTRNLFVVVSLLEIAGLVLYNRTSRHKLAKGVWAVSAVAGLVGIWFVYETGEHGGAVVYEYAGGVGTRYDDPADVQRLLVAGLYNEAAVARKAGRHEEAARLTQQLAELRPNDPSVRMLLLESQIEDLGQPRAALATIDSMRAAAPNDRRVQFQTRRLKAQAFEALGMTDSAKAYQGRPGGPR